MGDIFMLKKYGYLRVGAVVNKIQLADIDYNVSEIINLVKECNKKGIELATFPELSLCGCSVLDLLFNDTFYNSCLNGIKELKEFSNNVNTIFVVGAPLKINNKLYNCAITFYKGNILGITPKTYLTNNNENNEERYFTSASELTIDTINLFDEEVCVSNKLLYKCENYDFTYAIDFYNDLINPNSLSNITASLGANVILCLSAANELVGRNSHIKNLIMAKASVLNTAYIYASSSALESTSDLCYSGYSMICEANKEYIENNRFSYDSSIIYTDVDLQRVNNDKIKQKLYNQEVDYAESYYSLELNDNELIKKYTKTPFLNHTSDELEEILNIQAYALAKRIKHLNSKMVIGISGGSDSTLAFLVCLRVCKILNIDNSNIIAITMPGFGTSGRTYNNSKNLIISSGATFKEISIKNACIEHYNNIGHDLNTFDVAYENAQARERTQILFDYANMISGLVIGTGDLSELALGWATYNGDHMSNYAVNASIPKTLVTRLIAHIRDTSNGVIKETLTDILDTPISPELLPLDDNGNIKQDTQKSVGPYILHDFFLYHFLRYGASVKKLYYIACLTFKDDYTKEEIKRVLTIFIRRFFTQQFKRSCSADGIKVGSVGVSPRGDLRLNSDLYFNIYLKELNEL